MSLPSLPMTPANEAKFANETETQKYWCSLHNGILREAMQTSCGHRYCKRCIDKWLETHDNKKCPANEEDCVILSSSGANGEHINPDSSARREILNLKVFCPFQQFGCPKTVAWKKLGNHEASCEFKHIACPNNCGTFLKETDKGKHLQSECELRQETCQYCKTVFQSRLLKGHQTSDCPEVEILCPYKCQVKSIKRKQLQQHLEICPNKPIACKFKSAGCPFETRTDKDLKKHETDNINDHLEFLNKSLSQLLIERKDTNKVIEDLKQNRAPATKTVARQLEDKDREIQRQKQTVKDVKLQIVTMAGRMFTLERKTEEMSALEREVKDLKEKQAILERRLESSDTTQGGAGNSRVTTDQIAKHEQQLGIQDVRLAEMDLRFQIVETASYDGILMWKIREYSRRKQEAVAGKTISLYSQPFHSDRYGYKMCARVYLNGDGMGKNTHMSLFFVVMRGDYDALNRWPFSMKVTLMLLDQASGREHLTDSFRPDPASSSFKKPTSEMNIASGCPVFVSHTTLEQRKYLHEDTIFIKVVVSD